LVPYSEIISQLRTFFRDTASGSKSQKIQYSFIYLGDRCIGIELECQNSEAGQDRNHGQEKDKNKDKDQNRDEDRDEAEAEDQDDSRDWNKYTSSSRLSSLSGDQDDAENWDADNREDTQEVRVRWKLLRQSFLVTTIDKTRMIYLLTLLAGSV
jgi:hypothetical protein